MAKKKKKKFKWYKPLIALLVIGIVLGAPIATLYLCFYDSKEITVDENKKFDKSTFLKQRVLSSLDETKDNGQINVKVSEDDFNQLLLQGTNTVKETIPATKKVLTGASLEATKDNYTFSIYGHVGKLFKSNVSIKTKMGAEEIDGKECLAFEVEDIKLGRMSAMKVFKQNQFVKKYLNDNLVGSILEGTGFSLKSDIDQNQRIYYPKESIVNDISLFTGDLGSGSLYNALMQEYFHQGMFDVDFNENGFEGGINLVPAHYNDAFVSADKANSVRWNDIKNNVATVLNNTDLGAEYASVLYKYFINGFSKLTEEEQAPLIGFDFSSIGIDDVENYKGVIIDYDGEEIVDGKIVRPQVSIKANLASQVDQSNCDPGDVIATLDENELNKTLQSSDSIGSPYVFANKDENGQFKVTTFTVDNMYANIYDNSIKIAVSLSVNGYDTYICMDTHLDSASDLNMTFIIDNLYYGANETSEAFKQEIFQLLFDSFANDEIVSLDRETQSIKINITDTVQNEKYNKIIAAGGTDQIVEGETKDENGLLIFKVKNN